MEVLDLARDGKMGVYLDGSPEVGVSRLEVTEGPTGRRRRTPAERARIAVESMMPGVKVADVARRHDTTRWQVYDWRKQLPNGKLALPESVSALPMFAELVVKEPVSAAPSVQDSSVIEIVVGDVTIRTDASAEEGRLTRVIRAARFAVR